MSFKQLFYAAATLALGAWMAQQLAPGARELYAAYRERQERAETNTLFEEREKIGGRATVHVTCNLSKDGSRMLFTAGKLYVDGAEMSANATIYANAVDMREAEVQDPKRKGYVLVHIDYEPVSGRASTSEMIPHPELQGYTGICREDGTMPALKLRPF